MGDSFTYDEEGDLKMKNKDEKGVVVEERR